MNTCVKTRKAFRQGELLFVPVNWEELTRLGFYPGDKNSLSWNELGSYVIREGEITGHKHEVIEREPQTATLFTPIRQFLPGLPDMDNLGNEDKLLTVQQPVEVIHPEHRPLNLAIGIYLIIVQREYDEVKARRIMD